MYTFVYTARLVHARTRTAVYTGRVLGARPLYGHVRAVYTAENVYTLRLQPYKRPVHGRNSPYTAV